jgi:prepilin-type N-terminal cleavage/methylation domain-containing protein
MKKQAIIDNSRGFTIIELLVVVTIGVVVILVVFSIINQIFVRTSGGQSSYEAQADALASMNSMATEIRQATEVIAAQPQSITIRQYVDFDDTVPSQVRFYLQGDELRKGIIPPTGSPPTYTYNPANEVFDILSLRVANGANRIFTYYNEDGDELSSPVPVGAVTLVKIDLTIEQRNNPSPLSVSTRVQLRFNKNNL